MYVVYWNWHIDSEYNDPDCSNHCTPKDQTIEGARKQLAPWMQSKLNKALYIVLNDEIIETYHRDGDSWILINAPVVITKPILEL